MNKRDEIKIEVLSSIDDQIIEKQTDKRYRLMLRNRINRKKLTALLSSAACLLLAGSLFWVLLLPGIGKQIPIYQGMTVSNKAQTVAAAEPDQPAWTLLAAEQGRALSRLRPLSVLKNGNNGNHYGNDKNPNEEAETSSLQLEDARPLYYAQQNQDIYITIHFSNPDNFEILSFTLNGEKYSSYMFEEGSDMEHLILKKNVGNAEGVVEYTIDAIKYVDGTDIKDVQMNGDRTVKVGVYSENQPTATVESLTPDFNALRMNVTVADPLSLVSLSEGSLYAVLYQGETKVAEQALTVGESTAVAFEDLILDTEYRYAIEAEYDNLSGEGVRRYTLKEETVRTLLALRIDAAEPTQTALSFNLTWNESYGQKELTSLALYQGETKLKDLPLETVQLTDLLSNNEYLIRATYLNGTETKTVDYTFKTQAKATPTVTLGSPTKTQTSLGFAFTETDPDHVGAITRIELLHGSDTPVVAENTDVRNFADLLSNNTYTVKVTYVYNLNDGAGDQTDTKTLDVKTDAKATPVFTVANETTTAERVTADLSYTDPDGILASYKVELYKGSALVGENAEKKIDFSTLDAYTDYTVKITYTYDLNDGVGTQTATKTLEVKTLPVIDVTACTVTNTEAIVSGETISMILDLNNPSGVNVTHVTVSGEKYAVTTFSAARLLIHIPCDESFPGGEATLTVETLEGTLSGKTYTLTPATEASQTVFINGNLTVLGIEFVNESMEPVSWAFTSDTVYLMIRLENPTGYTVDQVTVDGTAYTPTKLSDNEYYCAVPLSSGSGSYTLSVSALSYRNENLEKSLTLTETCDLLCVNTDNVQYVSTPEDLLNMNGGYYELTGDVDLSGKQWQGSAFSGVLNGKGYAVKNLSYIGTVSDGASVGLFSTAQGLIWNLSLENVNLVVEGEGAPYVGALAGSSSESLIIENCHVSGSISVSGSFSGETVLMVGGLVGNSSGKVTITNSTVSGSISVSGATGSCVGGLVGRAYSSSVTITNSTNSGAISVTVTEGYACVGGLVGRAYSSSVTIINCTNSGAVCGTNTSFCNGGLVGNASGGSVTITNSANLGTVSGTGGQNGGMVGYANGGSSVAITNSANLGTVSGTGGQVGGMVGATNQTATVTITSSTNNGTVTVSSTGTKSVYAGGLVGWALSGSVTITNSTNNGTVTVSSTGTISVYAGGLVGDTEDGATATITNSYTTKKYNTTDVLCTTEQLNTPSFYTDTLGWSLEIWDLSDLDVANGKYPKLK